MTVDVNGNRITSGSVYDAATAALRRSFTPPNEQVTDVQARICEFSGTSAERCNLSSIYTIIKVSPPPPASVMGGNGWYPCQYTYPGVGLLSFVDPVVGPNQSSG